MRANPINDFLAFLMADTGDQNALGPYKYLTVALYVGLLVAGLAIAWVNWSRDPSQRTGKHFSIFVMRFVAAGMWYQGSLWKLPWPVNGGFRFWLDSTGKYSAFQFHSDIMNALFIPHVGIVQPLVYLLEIFLTASLMLGFAVRLSGLIAVVFTLNLWIGLYNDPTEWAWTYIGIVMAHGMFVASDAGRSLGLDNLLRRWPIAPLTGNTLLARGYRLAS